MAKRKDEDFIETEKPEIEVSDWMGEMFDADETDLIEPPVASRSIAMKKPVYYALCHPDISMAISRGTRRTDLGSIKSARSIYFLEGKDRLIDYFDEEDEDTGIYVINKIDKVIAEQKITFGQNKQLWTLPKFKKIDKIPPASVIELWTERKMMVNNAYNTVAKTEGNRDGLFSFYDRKLRFFQCWGWYLYTGKDVFYDYFPRAELQRSR